MSIRFFVAQLDSSSCAERAGEQPPLRHKTRHFGLPLLRRRPAGPARDACKLMLQADLEALFPGQTGPPTRGQTLSGNLTKVLSYVEGCQYVVKLPSPTSKMEQKQVCDAHHHQMGARNPSPPADVVQTFASIRDTREEEGLGGSEAQQAHRAPWPTSATRPFKIFSEYEHHHSRPAKGRPDLRSGLGQVFTAKARPNAVALASQVAKRWPRRPRWSKAEGAHCVEQPAVDIPGPTRGCVADSIGGPVAGRLRIAPAGRCVRAVFGDMKVDSAAQDHGGSSNMSPASTASKDLPETDPLWTIWRARAASSTASAKSHDQQYRDERPETSPPRWDSSKKLPWSVALKVGGADTPVVGPWRRGQPWTS